MNAQNALLFAQAYLALEEARRAKLLAIEAFNEASAAFSEAKIKLYGTSEVPEVPVDRHFGNGTCKRPAGY